VKIVIVVFELIEITKVVVAFITSLVLLLQNVLMDMARGQCYIGEEKELEIHTIHHAYISINQMHQIISCTLHDFSIYC